MRAVLVCVVLMLVGVVRSQDQGFESYVYQSNPLCEFRITLQADDVGEPLFYHLTFDGTVTYEGLLGADESLDMYLQVGAQWYILVVEREAEDRGDYSVNTGLACDGRKDSDAPPPPSPELMAVWERAQEHVMVFRQAIFGEP